MFQNVFSFNGRIRRLEFGLTYVAYFVVAMILNFLIVGFDPETEPNSSQNLILFLAYLPLIYVMLAQGAKRCHDRGNSGWWQLIPFYVFWMLFADSEPGINEYGPNPKGIGNVDEIDEIGNYLAQ
jgi:uncharacterized membrane protein YhaH (DUF805 family)